MPQENPIFMLVSIRKLLNLKVSAKHDNQQVIVYKHDLEGYGTKCVVYFCSKLR